MENMQIVYQVTIGRGVGGKHGRMGRRGNGDGYGNKSVSKINKNEKELRKNLKSDNYPCHVKL